MHGSLTLDMALLFIGLGLAVGVLNILAGGGSLLAMPLLIFFGLPEMVANGTVRVAILWQCIAALIRYHQAGRLDLAISKRFVPPTLIGALLGALIGLFFLPDRVYRHILAVIMLAVAILVVRNPRWLREDISVPGKSLPPRWTAVLMGLVGVYGGMVQGGVGYLILAVIVLAEGQTLMQANVQKVVIIAAYMPIAIIVFGLGGKVHVPTALFLTVGQMAGAWFGASLAISHGASIIRKALLVAVVLTSLKLMGADTFLINTLNP